MSNLIAIVLPTFGLIGLGYAAGRLKLLGERAGDGLSDYVMLIAVPSLIFRTLSSGASPAENPWGYWIAYFAGVAAVWAVAMVAASRLFGRDRREAAVHGFSAAQSNTVLVGVPLILEVYGEAGATPLFLLLAIHLPIMMSAAALLIESAGVEAKPRAIALRLARTIATHPVILALVAGLLVQRFGHPPTGVVKAVIDQLAATASPCALIAMGLALKRFGFLNDMRAVALISALKLVVHPFLVWLLAFHVLDVPPVWAGVAVLFAAMPCGINAYLISARYKTGEPTASSAIAVSTALSVVTVSVWLLVIAQPEGGFFLSEARPERFTIGDGAAAREIAVLRRDGTGPCVVWLGGFLSEMTATKATALDRWAAEAGRAMLRFDYSGHGASGGRFEEGTIGQWLEDSLAAIKRFAGESPVLVGSSMGGWMALLAARAMTRPPAGLVLIAPAVDFTEELMWARFSDEVRATIMAEGVWRKPSEYSPEPTPVTRRLIDEGRDHLMLGGPIRTGAPVHILQGMEDPDVPWSHALKLVERLAEDDVVVTLIKDGDHRLSRPEDLARIVEAVDGIAERA